ncbi:MAG TPA: aminotransferase class V-fold PLP-dependent enzyme [Chryseosolibacter sp.]
MLKCKQSEFSLPTNVSYLNGSYMAPLLKSVEKVGIKGLREKRNPTLLSPERFFTDSEILRQEFAKLIHAPDPKSIAIIASVSYGIASVAKNITLKPGDEIVVAAEQFPSNYYAWAKLAEENRAEVKAISPPDTLVNRGKIWNERILDAISPKTKVVALGNVHWADGTKFNLREIRKRTNDVSALLIIDGTQSVGALPFDVQDIRPDALICAGYKWLLGPYGSAVAYFGDAFKNGIPLEENWINRLNSEDFSGLVTYENRYQPGALRYDVGEHSNFILVPMLIKAISQLNKWKVENVQEYCRSITQGPIERLREKGFWVEDEGFRGSHLFGIRLPKNIETDKVKTALLKNKVFVSYRGSAIRVSPNVYNKEADLNKLVKVLSKIG